MAKFKNSSIDTKAEFETMRLSIIERHLAGEDPITPFMKSMKETEFSKKVSAALSGTDEEYTDFLGYIRKRNAEGGNS
ncbi:hypothetical protein [Rhizobium sp. L43]|uniref:hypothetical protein n=1 Tax=Rhizobium sp. L43 TaxID=2035452 RepID=UPI000BE85696|nr:hypothetical protein [Rhizobium sp. L43]PDS75463.1 hypothetical protein CO667_26640 [Rhizobium sp. L43]